MAVTSWRPVTLRPALCAPGCAAGPGVSRPGPAALAASRAPGGGISADRLPVRAGSHLTPARTLLGRHGCLPWLLIGAPVRVPCHARLPVMGLAETRQDTADCLGLAAVTLASPVPVPVGSAAAPLAAHVSPPSRPVRPYSSSI